MESALPRSLALLALLPLLGGCLLVHMRPQCVGTAVADGTLRSAVEQHVRALSGPRNLWHPAAYAAAETYIRSHWEAQGYAVSTEPVMRGAENLIAELPGGPGIVLLGAHYDSCANASGADDNASGVAVLLEVSRLLAGHRLTHTVRFVAYANEEPPFFQQAGMGSVVDARAARARGDDLVATLVMDAVGYYSDAPGSQSWPIGLGLFLTGRADFIAVVSNVRSAGQVRVVSDSLRRHGSIPIGAAATPTLVTGVDWSDHWAYWQEGYDAVLLTDMPPFRNPNYHEVSDLPETLDFDRLARFAAGLAETIVELAGG
jgi:hypothetical protein